MVHINSRLPEHALRKGGKPRKFKVGINHRRSQSLFCDIAVPTSLRPLDSVAESSLVRPLAYGMLRINHRSALREYRILAELPRLQQGTRASIFRLLRSARTRRRLLQNRAWSQLPSWPMIPLIPPSDRPTGPETTSQKGAHYGAVRCRKWCRTSRAETVRVCINLQRRGRRAVRRVARNASPQTRDTWRVVRQSAPICIASHQNNTR